MGWCVVLSLSEKLCILQKALCIGSISIRKFCILLAEVDSAITLNPGSKSRYWYRYQMIDYSTVSSILAVDINNIGH